MAKKVRSYKLWLVLVIINLLLIIGCIGVFLQPYYIPADRAIAMGTRAEINVKTGEVRQANVTPPPAPTDEEIAKAAQDEVAKVQEEAVAAGKAEDAKEEKAADGEEAAPKDEKAVPAEKKEPEKAVEAKAEKETPAKKEAEKPAAEESKAAPEAEKTIAVKEKKVVAPAPVVAKGPRIAIVVIETGLSRSSTDEVLKLPAPVSLSFSPYASDMAQWVKKAVEGNHEVYLDLPMEPKDYPYTDPGPYAVLKSLSDEKNLERLNEVLKRGAGYRGLVSGPDEGFTENAHSVEWLLNAIKDKEMTFTYVARPSNRQFTQQVEKLPIAPLGIDFVLDKKLSTEAIDAVLADAEAMAQKSGYAVIMARSYPISVQRLQNWFKKVESKGIHVVPLSQIKAGGTAQ